MTVMAPNDCAMPTMVTREVSMYPTAWKRPSEQHQQQDDDEVKPLDFSRQSPPVSSDEVKLTKPTMRSPSSKHSRPRVRHPERHAEVPIVPQTAIFAGPGNADLLQQILQQAGRESLLGARLPPGSYLTSPLTSDVHTRAFDPSFMALTHQMQKLVADSRSQLERLKSPSSIQPAKSVDDSSDSSAPSSELSERSPSESATSPAPSDLAHHAGIVTTAPLYPVSAQPAAAGTTITTTTCSSSAGSRRRGKACPAEMKDSAYWERRRRNNAAAKRSRDARRAKEDQIATRAALLEQENFTLRVKVAALNQEMFQMRALLQAAQQ